MSDKLRLSANVESGPGIGIRIVLRHEETGCEATLHLPDVDAVAGVADEFVDSLPESFALAMDQALAKVLAEEAQK